MVLSQVCVCVTNVDCSKGGRQRGQSQVAFVNRSLSVDKKSYLIPSVASNTERAC